MATVRSMFQKIVWMEEHSLNPQPYLFWLLLAVAHLMHYGLVKATDTDWGGSLLNMGALHHQCAHFQRLNNLSFFSVVLVFASFKRLFFSKSFFLSHSFHGYVYITELFNLHLDTFSLNWTSKLDLTSNIEWAASLLPLNFPNLVLDHWLLLLLI